jgi:hypothetical protein
MVDAPARVNNLKGASYLDANVRDCSRALRAAQGAWFVRMIGMWRVPAYRVTGHHLQKRRGVEMMWELIIRLRGGPLDSEERVRPLLEELAALPGFEPERYDLNQHGNWRTFDLERSTVDALTQRTQLVRLAEGDDDDGQLAMVAMGKHGEQPTAVVRLRADAERLDEIVDHWGALFERLPVDNVILTDSDWREALAGAVDARAELGGLPGMVQAWSPGASARPARAVGFEGGRVECVERGTHTTLWFAPGGAIEDREHLGEIARAWSRL